MFFDEQFSGDRRLMKKLGPLYGNALAAHRNDVETHDCGASGLVFPETACHQETRVDHRIAPDRKEHGAVRILDQIAVDRDALRSLLGGVLGAADSHRAYDPRPGSTDALRDGDLLPLLHDVQLLWIAPQGLMLSGFERMDAGGTATDYAQSWWCRMA
jgi:hypothetical protein